MSIWCRNTALWAAAPFRWHQGLCPPPARLPRTIFRFVIPCWVVPLFVYIPLRLQALRQQGLSVFLAITGPASSLTEQVLRCLCGHWGVPWLLKTINVPCKLKYFQVSYRKLTCWSSWVLTEGNFGLLYLATFDDRKQSGIPSSSQLTILMGQRHTQRLPPETMGQLQVRTDMLLLFFFLFLILN